MGYGVDEQNLTCMNVLRQGDAAGGVWRDAAPGVGAERGAHAGGAAGIGLVASEEATRTSGPDRRWRNSRSIEVRQYRSGGSRKDGFGGKFGDLAGWLSSIGILVSIDPRRLCASPLR